MRAKLILPIFVIYLPFGAPLAVLQLLDLASSTVDLILKVGEAWQLINDYGDFTEIMPNEKAEIFIGKMETINIQLEETNSKLQHIEKNVENISRQLRNLPATISFHQQLKTINIYQKYINLQFNKMVKLLQNLDPKQFIKYENSTIIDFANHVVSADINSVSNLIQLIYDSFSDQEILDLSLQKINEMDKDIFCNLQNSPQQWFLSLLQQYLKTQGKSYLIIQFAYMMKNRYGLGNFTRESADATNDFKARTDSIILTIKKYAAAASRELWKCDPQKHIEGRTFVAFSNLIRGFLINEILLNSKQQCYDGCSAMSYTNHKVQCGTDNWCKQTQPTCPKILECHEMKSQLKVCVGNNSGRRYEYLEQGNGRRYGNKASCRKTYYLDSYKYRLVWTCSYCFCLCDEGPKFYSDRFINLRSVIADIKNNRVVIGIRFAKHNRIIHLQIQEGKLLEHGVIDKDTIRWVPIENYKITDRYIYEDQDFHTLTWLDRGINLQNLAAKNGSVVTGLRFNKIGQSIHLEIVSTPFNFTTGQLQYRKSVYQNEFDAIQYKFRKELHLTKPDVSTRATSASVPDHSGDYIQFTHTDFDKDAGQTTIPFFDAQPVESLIPVPLTGLGIFYKGEKGFGGFITPKIQTYDYSQHLQPIFDEYHQKS